MVYFFRFFVIGCLLWSTPSYSEEEADGPLTKSQGDAILKELRAIRQLLQEQNTRGSKKPRAPEYVDMKIEGRPYLGSDDAPIVIVEFTDYQCPFCQRFHNDTFPKLKENYIDTGKVRFVSMDLPLGFHANANAAANAAKCAGDQGKFWELRDIMIDNFRKLELADIDSYARDLRLDMTAFASCMEQKTHQGSIDADLAAAKKVGITGTPTFLVAASTDTDKVKGRKIVGAQRYEAFEGVMKTELAKQKAANQKKE